MPKKGLNYTGAFRTMSDAIFVTNNRQLVTQAHENSVYAQDSTGRVMFREWE
jgi:hypothetical protein